MCWCPDVTDRAAHVLACLAGDLRELAYVVHDVLSVEHPDWSRPSAVRYFPTYRRMVLDRNDLLLTVS